MILIILTLGCAPKVTDIRANDAKNTSLEQEMKAGEAQGAAFAEEEPREVKPGTTVLVASLRRTPCYGKCPAYELRFLSNGVVTYEGTAHVERLGLYESFVNLSVLREIQQKARDAGFFQLADRYPTDGSPIVDFPNTITFVRSGRLEKSVTNNHQAPEALQAFEQYLDGIGEQLTWRKKGAGH